MALAIDTTKLNTRGARYAKPLQSKEQLFALIETENYKDGLAEVRRKGTQEAKKEHLYLLRFNNYFPEEGGPVKGNKTEANTCYADYDGTPPEGLSAAEKQQWYEDYCERLKAKVLAVAAEGEILFAQKSSRHHGVGIAFRRRPELTQDENIAMIDQLLGEKHDTSADEVQHGCYTSGKEDIFLLDDRLFINEPCPIVGRKSQQKQNHEENEGEVVEADDRSIVWNGFSTKEIAAKYLEMYNGGKPVREGSRNNKVNEFAWHLKKKCTSLNELLSVTPNYFGQEGWDEFRGIVERKWNENGLPEDNRIDAVLAALRQEHGTDDDVPPHLETQYYPSLMKLLASKVPDYYKGVVASNQFAALATWMNDVKFVHWLDGPREIGFFQLLIGEHGTGKSLINRPYDCILEPIRARDEKQRAKENEWRAKNSGKQEKEKQPRGVVQVLPHKITAAKLIERLEDADKAHKKHLNVKVDEIELLSQFGGFSKENVKTLITIAFDHGLWGSETKSADGAQGVSPLRLEAHASTTPLGADEFFTVRDTEKGIQRRTAVWPLFRPKDRKIKPKQEEYDQAFKDELMPYLDRLAKAKGNILVAEANKFCEKIDDELCEMIDAAKEQYWDAYVHTAVMYGWMKGCLLYVAEGEWNKKIEHFVRWSIYTHLWACRRFFGKKIEEGAKMNKKSQTFSTAPTMLDMLPDSFIIEEVKELRLKQKKTSTAKYQISNWKKRGLIIKDEATGKYMKTPKGRRMR